MATSAICGYPLWLDGMTFSGLLGRRFDSGAAVYDAGTPAALTPGAGVFAAGSGGGLAITAPGSGLSVNIAAGYASCPSSTPQAGAYIFGLMASSTLTVASNSSGHGRIDLVCAYASDLASSSSAGFVAIVTGTPASSPVAPALPANGVPLATVAVANTQTNIISANITDLRTWVVAPGCILPIATAAAAPAGPPTRYMYEADLGLLVRGTGTAGTVVSTVGAPAAAFSYHQSGFPAVTVTADGKTDYSVYYEREPIGSETIDTFFFSGQQVYIQLLIDGRVVDTTYAWDRSGNVIGRVSATYYTSSGRGTTPSKGTHKFSLTGTAVDAYHSIRVSAAST